MTPSEERQTLTDMLQSDGWRLFKAHIDQEFGADAYERTIDDALADSPAEDERYRVARIRDTFKAARKAMRWPDERVRELTQSEPAAATPDMYQRFRAAKLGGR